MPPRPIVALLFIASLALAWWVGRTAGTGSAVVAPPSRVQPATARSPSLPAPKIAPSTSPASSPTPPPPASNAVLERLLKTGDTKLTATQLQSYLAQNKRDAESLITASRLTDDLALLREAAQRFPNDPRVQFDLAMRSDNDAERQRAAAALAAADPSNAMGSYLSASEAFKAGNADEAVRQLSEAAGRASLDDYMMQTVQSAEDAYLAAGYDPIAAKAVAMFGNSMSHATELTKLGRQMSDLAKSYTARGDADSAQAIRDMGLALGLRMQSSLSSFLISDLVGMGIQKRFLDALDPRVIVDAQGTTAQQRRDQLAEHKTLITHLTRTVDPTSPQWSPQLLSQYLERVKLFGELAAMQWLQGKQQP